MKKFLLTLLQIWHNICVMAKKKNPYVKGLENKIARLEQQVTSNKLLDAADLPGKGEQNQEAFFISFNKETKNFEFTKINATQYSISNVKILGDSKPRVLFELNKMVAHEELLPKEK